MSPLLERLARLIAEGGPISVADYMAHCLGDPEHGYYMTRDPLGAAGDFTTAPEVSQMFGEIVGAWLVHAWRRAGAPAPIRLVELGPGRGTLMADILRVARLDPDFLATARLHLVETSPVLRAKQAETLAKSPLRPTWHGAFSEVPAGPLFLVTNEFFDALPVRQFVRAGGEWRERVVGLVPDGGLRFGIGPNFLPDGPAAPEGSILEISPARNALAAEIGRRIAADGGAAIILDYGQDQNGIGDTFQAVRRHGYTDPLAAPGEADLTAHVDFAALARAAEAEGAYCHGPIAQGYFLKFLGLVERAAQLKPGKDAAAAADIDAAVERLAGPDQMGTLFKVMTISWEIMGTPPDERTPSRDAV